MILGIFQQRLHSTSLELEKLFSQVFLMTIFITNFRNFVIELKISKVPPPPSLHDTFSLMATSVSIQNTYGLSQKTGSKMWNKCFCLYLLRFRKQFLKNETNPYWGRKINLYCVKFHSRIVCWNSSNSYFLGGTFS